MSFKFCPECGFKFDKDYNFCPKCRYSLGKEKAPSEPLFVFSDDTGSYRDTSFGGFDKMLNDRQKVATDMENIKRANVLCMRGEFGEAEKLVQLFIDKNYDRIEGYIALLRVHSKDYTVYEGAQIEKDLQVIQKIAGRAQINDDEYSGYIFARKRYFADKKAAEDARKKAEADRKVAEEAARRKAEADRKVAEEAARRKAEADRKAAEEAARRKAEADRKAAEEAARRKAEADRKAAEEAARRKAEADRKAAEEAARKKAEAERRAKEEAERKMRLHAEYEAEKKRHAEKLAAEEAARAEAEAKRLAEEEQLRREYEEAERIREEARRKAPEKNKVDEAKALYRADKQNKAVAVLTKAAKKGNAEAMYELGKIYDKSYDGKSAFEWYLKAAEQGYAEAQCEVAYIYLYGGGITYNYQQSFIWAKKAAEQKIPRGYYVVGLYYNDAMKDTITAQSWFKKAAFLGDPDGMYAVGLYYQERRIWTEAEKWYRKAAEQGHEPSLEKLRKGY